MKFLTMTGINITYFMTEQPLKGPWLRWNEGFFIELNLVTRFLEAQ